MHKPDKKQAHTKPKKHTSTSVNIDDIEINKSVQKAEGGYKPHQLQSQIYKRVIAFFANPDNQPKTANIISFGMLIATIVLAIYTYKVFNQTSKQTAAAINAAKLAYIADSISNKALEFQKRTQKSSDSLRKITDKQQSNKDSSTLKVAQDGLRAQIDNFRESQKEFEVENRPFVQIVNIKFESALAVGTQIEIGYDFVNYGKQPVKCLVNRCTVYLDTTRNFKSSSKIKYRDLVVNSYMGNGATSHHDIQLKLKKPITEEFIDFVKESKQYFYVLGILEYQNTVTLRKSFYHYNYRLYMVGNNSTTEGVVDTTIDSKSKSVKLEK